MARGSGRRGSRSASAPNVDVQQSRFISPWRTVPGEPTACAMAMPRRIASRASVRAPSVVSAKPMLIVKVASRALSPASFAARTRAPPRVERSPHLAAGLAHDGERLPRVDVPAGDAVLLREREEAVGDLCAASSSPAKA